MEFIFKVEFIFIAKCISVAKFGKFTFDAMGWHENKALNVSQSLPNNDLINLLDINVLISIWKVFKLENKF